MAKKLQITAINNLGEKAVAEVPYETGKYEWDKDGAFSKNIYVGPDYGFSLGSIAIDAKEGRIHYGFSDSVLLKEGKAEAKIELRTQTINLIFELK